MIKEIRLSTRITFVTGVYMYITKISIAVIKYNGENSPR